MIRLQNSFNSLSATLAAAGLTTSLGMAAVITIDPANVQASSQIGGMFDRLDDYIVNGNGLTGGQHLTAVQPNMWLSTGESFGGVDADPNVVFDLGNVYVIDSIQVWNYNEAPPNLTSRGVNAVTVEYGLTNAFGSSVPGITNFAQASGLDTYEGEVFSGFAPFEARFIRFDIGSNHGDPNTFYGLSEVQFSGTPLIPEPGSSILLGFGGLGLLFSRRRLRP